MSLRGVFGQIKSLEVTVRSAACVKLKGEYLLQCFFCSSEVTVNAAAFYSHSGITGICGAKTAPTNLNSFGGYVIYKNDPFGKRVASYNFNISRYVQGIATKAEKIIIATYLKQNTHTE